MRDLHRIKEKVVIRLDNRQVALAIVGFVAVSAATFGAGVVVGKKMADQLPGSIDEVAGITSGADALDDSRTHRQRHLLMARITPGTRTVDSELAKPPQEVAPADPSRAARIEAYRQIAKAREQGVVTSLGPVAVAAAEEPARAAVPLTLVERNPDQERAALDPPTGAPAGAFALHVSAFASKTPADVVAEQLKSGGHDARVRAAGRTEGEIRWRVEIGRFADARKATTFQDTFERDSGYSTVLVPVP